MVKKALPTKKTTQAKKKAAVNIDIMLAKAMPKDGGNPNMGKGMMPGMPKEMTKPKAKKKTVKKSMKGC